MTFFGSVLFGGSKEKAIYKDEEMALKNIDMTTGLKKLNQNAAAYLHSSVSVDSSCSRYENMMTISVMMRGHSEVTW